MDLRTNYLGLELKNPLVASASPLARELVNIRRMEDAGAAASSSTRSSRKRLTRKATRWTGI